MAMVDMELPEMEDRKVGDLYSKTDILKYMGEFFNDALPRMGLQEDHFWTNIRIILTMGCCGMGLYAQFGLNYKKDRYYMMATLAGYYIFTGLVALIDYFAIKKSVICIKVADESAFLDVIMESFSSEVTIALRSKARTVSHKTSVGNYFDKEGYLCQEELHADFVALVKRFEKEAGAAEKGEKKKDK
eukprot:TRINITY_DN2696_c0_g1_i3.p1 TRINITY_DN2696_c0_g1~~TRINITY_DN2696_c0_g1_i3.p1  ORF type:complete len:219 (-),score=46.36 TRINITY_DN2696_c0_g1_i3:224-787(-)